jgi:membrane protein DedA with SNARE-associated domain
LPQLNELIQILVRYGYLLVFGIVLGEQLGLPLPAELFLLAAGAMAGGGNLNFAPLFFLAILACGLADVSWYEIGRHKGGSVLSFLCRISLNPDSCVRGTRNIFSRHGAPSLLVVKFIPGVNTFAAPLSGISRLRLSRFLLFDGLGACIWVGTFLGVGYLFSRQLEQMVGLATRLGTFLGVIVYGGLAGYVAWKYTQRQRFLNELRMARITPEELKAMLDAGKNPMIMDVRSSLEFEAEPQTIVGALYLPLEELEKIPLAIPPGRELILYCN